MSAGPQPQRDGSQPIFEQSYKLARIIHAGLLLTVVLYAGIAAALAPGTRAIPAVLPIALGAVAGLLAVAALVLRSRLVGPSEEILRTRPDDLSAMARWRVGQIISFALAEAVVLYGLVLKFVGAEWKVAGVFFAAGAALMLMFTPQRP